MNSKQEEFILENRGRYSASELAQKLSLKEREIKRFLKRQQKIKSASVIPLPPQVKPKFLFWVFPLLIILGFLIYSNTFDAEFHYDDFHNIVENSAVHNLLRPDLVWQSHKDRFLTYLSFALNYQFGKTEVWGYHLINILIHIAASLSVYLFTILLFCTPRLAVQSLHLNPNRIALAAALLFLCHPIQIQAVTYIVQRAASLATFFYLSACILYLWSRFKPAPKRYWSAVAVTVAAMFAKQTAFTLPLALILLEYFFFPCSYYPLMKRLRFLFPFLVTMAIPLGIRSSWVAEAAARGEVAQLAETDLITPFNYLTTQFSVIVTYLRLVFWPTGFSIYHAFPLLGFWKLRTILSLALLLLIALTGFLIRKKQPLVAFGISWFFLTLSVESSFLPIRHLIFEHRIYLPMVGVCLVFATLAVQILKNQKIFAGLFMILIITLSTMTYRRNFVWKTDASLWEDAASKYSTSNRRLFVGEDGRGAMERTEDKPFAEWEHDAQ